MELEVTRRPVGRRRTWPVAVIIGAAAVVVAIGALWPEAAADEADSGRDPGPAAPASAAPVASDATDVVATWEALPGAMSEPARRSRRWPARPRPICRDVDEARCQAVADAVLELVRPAGAQKGTTATPRVVALTVWGSLLCGDDLDCPTARLQRASSLGSAVVRFAGSTGALWVNVVAETAGAQASAGAAERSTRAWLVRWVP